jgi:hypothetical protein
MGLTSGAWEGGADGRVASLLRRSATALYFLGLASKLPTYGGQALPRRARGEGCGRVRVRDFGEDAAPLATSRALGIGSESVGLTRS